MNITFFRKFKGFSDYFSGFLGTADLQRSFQFNENGLTYEDFSGFDTETTDLLFSQIDLLSRLG